MVRRIKSFCGWGACLALIALMWDVAAYHPQLMQSITSKLGLRIATHRFAAAPAKTESSNGTFHLGGTEAQEPPLLETSADVRAESAGKPIVARTTMPPPIARSSAGVCLPEIPRVTAEPAPVAALPSIPASPQSVLPSSPSAKSRAVTVAALTPVPLAPLPEAPPILGMSAPPSPSVPSRPVTDTACAHRFLFVADKFEGLILLGAGGTHAGKGGGPLLKREITFNPGGLLNGACSVTGVAQFAYICCDRGLVVVALEHPREPQVTAIVPFRKPTDVQVRAGHAFVCDADGITSLDASDLARPAPRALLPLSDAHRMALARNHAYVAAGRTGLAILDIENPEHFRIEQVFNAGGQINDLRDVKIVIERGSEFAYLADGKNGLRVVHLQPLDSPGGLVPRLVATHPLPAGGDAQVIGWAIDRDRIIDANGYQSGVIGINPHPLSLEEQRRAFERHDQPWYVHDDPRVVLGENGK